jgi:hypothetical protein
MRSTVPSALIASSSWKRPGGASGRLGQFSAGIGT